MTWTPKNVPVLRYVNFTEEFTEIISVATPVESEPAWILNCSNVILCEKNKQIHQNPFHNLPRKMYKLQLFEDSRIIPSW